MRSLIFALALLAASTSHAQVGRVQVVGPWQPNPYGGWYHYDATYNAGYGGAYYAGRGYGYGGYYGAAYDRPLYDPTVTELRRIRWSLEDANWRRGRR